jgi:antitoxin VapB
MSEEYRSTSFKAGNSVAVRFPKPLGLEAGAELVLREEAGRYIVERADKPEELIDLSGIAGSVPWLKPLSAEERELEHSPRVWDDPDWPGWKAAQ